MSRRTQTVTAADAGKPLREWLRVHMNLSTQVINDLLRRNQVRVAGNPCSNPDWRLRPGQRVEIPLPEKQHAPAPARPKNIRLVHVDTQLVIVDKPAGLTTMRHAEEAAEFGARGKHFLPPTLEDHLPGLLPGRGKVIAVHRLDKETSGLVVFARNPQAARHLGQQFRDHTSERLYRALVRGKAVSGRIESILVRDRGDGRRGSGTGEGQRAVTHVRLVEDLGPFSLVECRLETGRTHQVRIHLGEAGTPLCGERVYDRPLGGGPYPDGSGLQRVALHAAVLGLTHPESGKRLRWESALPTDLARALTKMRGARS